MKHTCPHCGHEFDDNVQSDAAKARWKGVSKASRSEAASKAAKARWKAVRKAQKPGA